MVVGLQLRCVRVLKHLAWLRVGSGKVALSRPAHQQVTRPVRRTILESEGKSERTIN
jgi:hypothetical protein